MPALKWCTTWNEAAPCWLSTVALLLIILDNTASVWPPPGWCLAVVSVVMLPWSDDICLFDYIWPALSLSTVLNGWTARHGPHCTLLALTGLFCSFLLFAKLSHTWLCLNGLGFASLGWIEKSCSEIDWTGLTSHNLKCFLFLWWCWCFLFISFKITDTFHMLFRLIKADNSKNWLFLRVIEKKL